MAPSWQRRVAAAVGARAEDHIVEIGGGPGDLTALLAASGCRLTVVEVDETLAAGLRARFAGEPRVRVVAGDILRLDWAELASGPGRRRLCGNLPYYITSPILFRLFAAAAWFADATLMMQKEVAARVTAAPGTPAFGLLSAVCQLHSRPRRLFDVPPGAFRPAPRVTSTLLRLEIISPAAAPAAEAEGFYSFLRAAFAHKRKRLVANLRGVAAAERIRAAFAALGMPANARAEQCDTAGLLALYRALK